STAPSTSDSRAAATRAVPSLLGVRATPSMATSVLPPCALWPAELAKVARRCVVRQYPAVVSPAVASTKALTRWARSAGDAATSNSSTWPGGSWWLSVCVMGPLPQPARRRGSAATERRVGYREASRPHDPPDGQEGNVAQSSPHPHSDVGEAGRGGRVAGVP